MIVDGLNVEVSEGRGAHLLLVHGFCSSRAQWRPNLTGLARFCRPVVVELLGHGRSQSPGDPADYGVARYVRRFEAIRERLGAECWAVCGQSFGAGLTISYALAHPERVIGQVFTNSRSALAPEFLAVTAEQRRERAAAFERGGRAGLEAMAVYPRRAGRHAPEVEAALVADAGLISFPALVLAMATTMPGPSVADRLAEIRLPSLLVNGSREKAFQPLRDHAARAIGDLRVVDLDGGHAVNLDCPQGFNDAVRAFLADL